MSDVRTAVSAGGVVYRRRGGHVEIVLVARPRESLWALPKGTPEAGEAIEETALREVREETGLEVSIDRERGNGERGRIGAIRYSYRPPERDYRVDKVVHHFLMLATGGHLDNHDHEYDVVDWYDAHEAQRRMTYGNERSIVERALQLLHEEEAGPGTTDPPDGASAP